MAWVHQPIESACRARLIHAAPVSKPWLGEGLASVLPGAAEVVADSTAISAEARCAQAWLKGTRVWKMALKPGLVARP